MYLHVPMFISMTAIGAGVLTFVTNGEAVLPPVVRLMLCVSVALVYVFAGAAEWILEPRLKSPLREQRIALLHGVPAALALALGLLGAGLTPIPLLAVLVAITAVVVAVGQLLRERAAGREEAQTG
jgi:hypothetical protein